MARKPWISNRTLELIDKRNESRINGCQEEEIKIQKEIRNSVKHDRCDYLDTLAGGGTWSDLKKLRQGPSRMKGRLRNLEGVVVESDQKAETLADYFAKVQWRVRPVSDAGTQGRADFRCQAWSYFNSGIRKSGEEVELEKRLWC